jgi:hypothetical protein
MRRERALVPLLAVLFAGCAVEDTVATILGACDAANCPPACEGGVCVPSIDAARCEPSTRAPLCPTRTVGFDLGLCVCEDMVTLDRFAVERAAGAGAAAEAWGGLGVNQGLNTRGPASVAGSAWVAGGNGITFNAASTFDVGGSLYDQGVLIGAVRVQVGSDAEIGGDVSVDTLDVAGTLLTPAGVSVQASGGQSVGARGTGVVAVSPPCGCGADSRLPIAEAVAARRLQNDNAASGLDAFELDGFEGPRRVELDCGDYHWARLAGSGALDLTLRGDVAIFVDGEVGLDDAFRLHLEGAATLDLYVEGDFRVNGPLELGGANEAGRVRVFIAGSGTILLGADAVLAGPLFATDAALVSQRSLEIFGGLHVRRAAPEGALVVHHHDAATRDLFEACE